MIPPLRSHNQIVAFRNALIHGYDRIDYSKVWQAIQESLPILRAEVEHILREAGVRTFTVEWALTLAPPVPTALNERRPG